MELQQLTSQQKKELRIVYARYKELDRSEYPRTEEGRREYLADGRKIWDQIQALCPDITFHNIEGRIYSKRQLAFIEEFEGADGFRWGYGGRDMFGDVCPAITTDYALESELKTWENDQMGLDSVILYAQY